MSAVVRAFRAKRSRPQPWQNHELAEFYRVIDILGRSGLGVVPDMGVSDEGEPWFAFCRADTGEVIVHCARIDGCFIATSLSFNEVFYGNELRDVVNSILKSKHFAAVTPVADKRLYLHPAAVFTAFIAAALLLSHHAHATDANSGPAGGSSTDSAAFLKFLTAIKAALADGGAAGIFSAANEPAYFSEPNGFDAPISLGALMAASLAVLPTGDLPDVQGPSPNNDTSITPSDAPMHYFLQSFLSAMVLSELNHNTPIVPPDGSSSGTTDGVLPNFHGLNLTPSSGQTPLFAQADSTLQTTNSQPAFLASVDSSGDLHFNYISPPSLHAGTFVVMDQSVPAVQQTLTPAGHVFDIAEITPIALAIFTGTSSQIEDTGTPPPPPPAPHVSTDVINAASANGAADPTPTTTSDDTENTITTLPTTISSPPPTDDPPDTTVPDSQPTNAAVTPNMIFMGTNPVLGLEQLVDYALGYHPINAPLTESALLATTLTSYTAGGAALPVLVVFDSATVKQPVFELTSGIFFVDDHQLGVGQVQAPVANLVTVDLGSGGTMTLLGVIDPVHTIF
jgi:hypothetical protein